jgi:hypothetical protein
MLLKSRTEDIQGRYHITCDDHYSYVGLGHILPNRVSASHLSSLASFIAFCSIENGIVNIFTMNTRFHSCSEPAVLKMAEVQQAMYDGFSDKGAHSIKWFKVAKNFLKLVFAGDRHEAKCPCNRYRNRRMLYEYKMCGHIVKHKFISNYLVWHQHGEVQAATPTESDGCDDEERMDNMIADIGMEYDLGLEISNHHWWCRISIGSLSHQRRKCMMAPR